LSPFFFRKGRGNPLRPPIRLAALGEDLRRDGEYDLALLVAGLDVSGDDAAVGARLHVDLAGEHAAVLQRVAGVGRLVPGEIAKTRRGAIGRDPLSLCAGRLVALEA